MSSAEESNGVAGIGEVYGEAFPVLPTRMKPEKTVMNGKTGKDSEHVKATPAGSHPHIRSSTITQV